jgi:hypothetical protein
MTSACGITYEDAQAEIGVYDVGGIPVPFAEPRLLLRLKQTRRPKDEEDRIFLHRKIAEESGDGPTA